MVAQVSIRFLIGLSRAQDAAECFRTLELGPSVAQRQRERRAQALSYLGGAYGVGAAYDGRGYWKGESEPCMQFETIQTDSPTVRAWARIHAGTLRDMLGQEAIGLVFAPVELELI